MFSKPFPVVALCIVFLLSGHVTAADTPVRAADARQQLSPVLAEQPGEIQLSAPGGVLRSLALDRPVRLHGEADPERQALAVARVVAPMWGLLEDDKAEELEVSSSRRLGGGPLEHLDVRRRVEGILVSGQPARVSLTTDGRLVAVTGSISSSRVVSRVDLLGPRLALQLAAEKLEGRPLTGAPVIDRRAATADDATLLSWGDSHRQLAAWQRWVSMDDGLHLGWEVLYQAEDGIGMWLARVDGASGRLVDWDLLTRFEAPHGLVFDLGSPQPSTTPGTVPPSPNPPVMVDRSDVSFGGDPIASPLGWVGAQMITAGNNVIAREDHDGDSGSSTPGEPAEASDADFAFPLELGSGSLDITTFAPAVVTNLFYWTNLYHDLVYHLGFDEAAGNFQADNLGRGGRDGDPLRAFAQQGATLSDPSRNNAYMSTPPDGFSPVMGMFVWGPHQGGFFTDSSLDSDVVVHEYTHGITERLGRGLNGAQGGALHEGNSDFMPLNLLTPAGADPNGSYVVGGYSDQNFSRGIRTFPYSTDPSVNPLHYGHFGQVAGFPEPHADGEIWVEALWEARARLIQQHGDAEGRERIARLLLDGLLLSPPNPTMVEVRDGILLAERVRYLGEDQDALWEAFAERGLGFGAFGGPDGDTITVAESTSRPADAEPAILTLATAVVEGSSPGIWISDPTPAATPRLTVTTSSGDSESLPLLEDGALLTTEIITARGPVNPGDGVVQVVPDESVTFSYPGAGATTLPVRALHRIDYREGGLPTIAGEIDLELNDDDGTRQYALPFETPFAAFGGTTITVSTNGLLSQFPVQNDAANSAGGLAEEMAIAPMWYDLVTNGSVQSDEGVFVAVGDDWVRFRWRGETWEPGYAPGSPVNFACTLWADGRILFEYGSGNTGFNDAYGRQASPTVGIGYGDVALLVPGRDQADDLGEAEAVNLSPAGGLTPERSILSMWFGDQTELAFTLPQGHPEATVSAVVGDASVVELSGPASVTVPAGTTRATLSLKALDVGATSVGLTSSDGDGATLPVEVFRLAPAALTPGQLLVLTGPFGSSDAPAAVGLDDGTSTHTLTQVGSSAETRTFRLPTSVALGEAQVSVRWLDRTLPTASVDVVATAEELTVLGISPTRPTPGQRIRVLLAGSPAVGSGLELEAILTTGAAEISLPLRALLDDGSAVFDLPETAPVMGFGLFVRLLADTLLAEGSIDIEITDDAPLTVEVLPAAGGSVAAGSRVAVAGVGGGGLSAILNGLEVTAGGSSWTLQPFADSGSTVAYRLPVDLPAGDLEVTPFGTLNGSRVDAPSVSLSATANLNPLQPWALRSTDLTDGELVLDLRGSVAPGSVHDLQMLLASGERARLLDATAIDIGGATALFALPDDLPGGVLELSLRQRLGAHWSEWSEPAGVVLPGSVRVAAAAAAEGSNSTVWRTDMALLNPDTVSASADLVFSDGATGDLQVAPATQTTVSDVIGGLLATSGAGSLEIAAPGSLIVASRTYNQGGSGTFGQYLAGERATASLRRGRPVELIGLAESDAFRTNLGLVNAGASAARVRVTLRDADGLTLADRTVAVAADEGQQITRIFATWAGRSDIDTGRASLELLSGERLHVYASVVDNFTGDPTTVVPLSAFLLPDDDDGMVELWVPAAAAAEGVNDTVWRTDLVMANTGAGPAAVTVHLEGGATAQPLALELAAGETRRVSDIVGAGGFGVSGTGALRLETGGAVVALARVYNQAASGTFGQALVAVPPCTGLRAPERGWLPMLAGSAAFRTNLGLVNAAATRQDVEVDLFDDSGAAAGSHSVSLAPGEWRQLGDVLGSDHPAAFARVTLDGDEGPVLVYGSVVDNATGDPTTVPLVR